MSQSIDGRVAVITGASHGLGKAIALHLASLGAKVACIARQADPLKQTVEAIKANGGHALAVPCDVSDKEQVIASARTITSELGGVDILLTTRVFLPHVLFKRRTLLIGIRSLVSI